LFEEYFNELTIAIDSKNDLDSAQTLINSKIETFNQIKVELSEKGKGLIAADKELSDGVNSGRFDSNEQTTRDVEFKIICIGMLYDKQHQYIDKALTKLNDMRDGYLSKPTAPNEPQPQLQPQQSEQPQTTERKINADDLGIYFASTFKGMGNAINYFDMMIEELKTKRTGKDFAQIALMIYESNKMSSRKPKTFAEWLKIFCDCVGCKYTKYDKNKLHPPTDNLKKLFSYL
jgi:hypothetical protein